MTLVDQRAVVLEEIMWNFDCVMKHARWMNWTKSYSKLPRPKRQDDNGLCVDYYTTSRSRFFRSEWTTVVHEASICSVILCCVVYEIHSLVIHELTHSFIHYSHSFFSSDEQQWAGGHEGSFFRVKNEVGVTVWNHDCLWRGKDGNFQGRYAKSALPNHGDGMKDPIMECHRNYLVTVEII